MPTENEPYTIKTGGWTVRVRQPVDSTAQPRTILMIHGRQGNEDVMWIFAHKLPGNAWLFAPRATVSEQAGYSWLPPEQESLNLDAFQPVAEALMAAFESWAAEAGASVETFDVMGFSQGAALVYALAAFYPQRIERIVALAGFLPRDSSVPSRYSALKGKQVYIAHGTRDEIIPVRVAEEAAQILQSAGAEVSMCTSDVGHKMSADCLRGLEDFMES